MKNIFKCAFFSLLLLTSCENDNDEFKLGVIKNLGSCNWVVEVNSVRYSPEYIPDEFKVHNLEVELKFFFRYYDYFCQSAQQNWEIIGIEDIRKR